MSTEHTPEQAQRRTTITDAIKAWEDKGPTSLTVALLADALYGVHEHTQTILATPELVAQGVYGNCMQAAIATFLRKPLDAVPHFGAFTWWPGALRLWLRGEGLDYTVVKAPPIPQERAMLCGQSPRGYAHAVVSEAGRIVWDPHPSRDGLTTIKGAYVIHEWDPTSTAPSPVDALMHAEHHLSNPPGQGGAE